MCSEVSCRALPLCTFIRSHPPLAAVSSTSSPQPSAATRSYQRSQSTVVSVRPLSLQCSSGVFRLGDTLCICSPVGHFLHAGFCEVFPLRPLSQFCSAAVLWPGDTLCTCFTVGFVRSSFCLTAQLLSALSFRRESGLVQPTVHLRDFLRCLCAMWHRLACPGYTAQLPSALRFRGKKWLGACKPTVLLPDFVRCSCAVWHRSACPGYTAQLDLWGLCCFRSNKTTFAARLPVPSLSAATSRLLPLVVAATSSR